MILHVSHSSSQRPVSAGVQQHQPAQLARHPDRAAGDPHGPGADSHLGRAADTARRGSQGQGHEAQATRHPLARPHRAAPQRLLDIRYYFEFQRLLQ